MHARTARNVPQSCRTTPYPSLSFSFHHKNKYRRNSYVKQPQKQEPKSPPCRAPRAVKKTEKSDTGVKKQEPPTQFPGSSERSFSVPRQGGDKGAQQAGKTKRSCRSLYSRHHGPSSTTRNTKVLHSSCGAACALKHRDDDAPGNGLSESLASLKSGLFHTAGVHPLSPGAQNSSPRQPGRRGKAVKRPVARGLGGDRYKCRRLRRGWCAPPR